MKLALAAGGGVLERIREGRPELAHLGNGRHKIALPRVLDGCLHYRITAEDLLEALKSRGAERLVIIDLLKSLIGQEIVLEKINCKLPVGRGGVDGEAEDPDERP